MEDYRKYLSYDNGHGILLNNYDKLVLDKYKINYEGCKDIKLLIISISDYIDNNYYEDLNDLEIVLEHLEENYYYNQVNK